MGLRSYFVDIVALQDMRNLAVLARGIVRKMVVVMVVVAIVRL